jgi:hypothetical protein
MQDSDCLKSFQKIYILNCQQTSKVFFNDLAYVFLNWDGHCIWNVLISLREIQSPFENQTVWYGHFLDKFFVQFSNGKIRHLVFNHLKTGPVFRPQYIGKTNSPFENRTNLSDIQMPFEYQTI